MDHRQPDLSDNRPRLFPVGLVVAPSHLMKSELGALKIFLCEFARELLNSCFYGPVEQAEVAKTHEPALYIPALNEL